MHYADKCHFENIMKGEIYSISSATFKRSMLHEFIIGDFERNK